MDTNNIPDSGVAPTVPPVAQSATQAAPAPMVPVTPPAQGAQLPTGTSERTTEQFDKIKESNKRLYEANQILQQELARKAQVEQQFAAMQQPAAPQQQPQVEQFVTVDPLTGEQYVDEDRLKKAIDTANSRATRAESAVQSYIQQQQVREEQRQTEEAFQSHPQLNPQSEQFDGELSRRTRAFLLDSMMNPADYRGRPLTFREAGDLAKGQLAAQQGTAAAPVAIPPQQTQNRNLESRDQAAFAAQGTTSAAIQPSVAASEELANLRAKSRRGDLWAIAQRLSKVTHTGTPSSSSES